jgi:hypothetical protein
MISFAWSRMFILESKCQFVKEKVHITLKNGLEDLSSSYHHCDRTYFQQEKDKNKGKKFNTE